MGQKKCEKSAKKVRSNGRIIRRKLKPDWQKMDIPRRIKDLYLWPAMMEGPTYKTWNEALARMDWEETDEIYFEPTKYAYRSLKAELWEMPQHEVEMLPPKLRAWVCTVRPDLPAPEWASGQTGEAEDLDRRMLDHFDDLARIAAILAHRLLVLINESESVIERESEGVFVGGIAGYDIVGGLRPWPRLDYEEPAIDGISVHEPLDVDLAGDLLAHLNQDYPELALVGWEAAARNGNKRQVLREKLSLLARSKAFKPCSQCEVCTTLEGA
ncbi:MAG: hypothetical protein MUP21_06375 [Dehalococcoidia bacterium]|nr:hypothetical protein [Dehalococcoidia bacterium]